MHGFAIHASPVAGESGWIYIRFANSGSAFPATIHFVLWYLYLLDMLKDKNLKIFEIS